MRHDQMNKLISSKLGPVNSLPSLSLLCHQWSTMASLETDFSIPLWMGSLIREELCGFLTRAEMNFKENVLQVQALNRGKI